MRSLERRIPPAALSLMVAAAMYAAAWFTPAWTVALPGRAGVGLAVFAIGVIIGVQGVISFRRAGTSVNPLPGAATSRLVVAGVYRFTRNPMYLGMLCGLVGWGVALGNGLALPLAFAFIPLMNRLQIAPEEIFLTEKFGGDYAAYRAAVRRWL